jgi:hypothetical protein
MEGKIKKNQITDEAVIKIISKIVERAREDYIDSYIANSYGILEAVRKLEWKNTLATERLGKVVFEIKNGIIGDALGQDRTVALLEMFERQAKEVIRIMKLWMAGKSCEEIASMTGRKEKEVNNLIKKYKNTTNYKVIRNMKKSV